MKYGHMDKHKTVKTNCLTYSKKKKNQQEMQQNLMNQNIKIVNQE